MAPEDPSGERREFPLRPAVVRFGRLAHLLTLPARLAGTVDTRLVLDTGIGVNLLSSELAERVGWKPDGTRFTGRRMSGQAVSVPLGTLPSLAVGRSAWADAVFGTIDTTGFPDPLRGIGGFLSLGLFEGRRLVIAPRAGEVRIGEEPTPKELRDRLAEVPVHLVREGPSVQLFLDLLLPTGTAVRVEVDTGSEALILDERFMAGLGVRPDDPKVRRTEGVDETGQNYVRWATRLDGAIALADASTVRAPAGPTLFQRIIYDGLVGGGFLDRFDTGYDLATGRMSFAPLSPPTSANAGLPRP